MTWTYIPQLLTSTATAASLMQVRLLVGDTDTIDQQLQDEEIYFVLSLQSTVNYAAAECADMLSAKYARQVNTENSLLRVSAAVRHTHYMNLAKRLRANGPGSLPGGENAGLPLGGVFAGGTSAITNETYTSNDDNVITDVAVGQDDYVTNDLDPEDYFT
jgi:hypothetical protein